MDETHTLTPTVISAVMIGSQGITQVIEFMGMTSFDINASILYAIMLKAPFTLI